MFSAKKDVKIPTENGIYASGQITPMMNKEGTSCFILRTLQVVKRPRFRFRLFLNQCPNRPSYVLS